MRKLYLILITFITFVGINLSLAEAAINVTLETESATVKVSKQFKVNVNMSGSDTVGAVSMEIQFDKSKLQLISVTSDINGVVVPNESAINTANQNGYFRIAG